MDLDPDSAVPLVVIRDIGYVLRSQDVGERDVRAGALSNHSMNLFMEYPDKNLL